MSPRFIIPTGACALVASAAVVAALPAHTQRTAGPPSANDGSEFNRFSRVAQKPISRPDDRGGASDEVVNPLAGPATGDSCADPFIVPAIPYSTTGSTVSMADDYDVICTSAGFGGRDVVYQFDATEDVVVNISLCLNSNFDTRLYVYEDLCGDDPSVIACNEDQCPTPSQASAVVSQVFDLQLFNGSSYYIVIDGFNGVASGSYTLDISLDVPPCPEESEFVQEHSMPNNAWVFGNSDDAGPFIRAESYSVTNAVCSIRWWAIPLTFSGGFIECTEDPMSVTVNFHEDDAGAPGVVACTFDASISPTSTGIYYFGFELMEFNLDLFPEGCCTLTDGWISIIGGTDTGTDNPSCQMYWASSGNDGGPGAGSMRDPGTGWVSETYDLSICLTTGDPPVPCPGDIPDVSPGEVNVSDLLALLAAWGPCPDPCPPCPEDIANDDCVVNVSDLLFLLANWGPCE